MSGMVSERPRLGGEVEAAMGRPEVVLRPHDDAAQLASGFVIQRAQQHHARSGSER